MRKVKNVVIYNFSKYKVIVTAQRLGMEVFRESDGQIVIYTGLSPYNQKMKFDHVGLITSANKVGFNVDHDGDQIIIYTDIYAEKKR